MGHARGTRWRRWRSGKSAGRAASLVDAVSRALEQSDGLLELADWVKGVELHEEKESYLEGQLAAIYRGKSGLLAEEADGGGRRPGSVQKEREILLPGMTRKSDLTEVCCLRYERKQGHGQGLERCLE